MTQRALADGRRIERSELLSADLRSPPGNEFLARPLTVLSGVGTAVARRAVDLGIDDIGDLLLHMPVRHDDYRDVRDLSGLAIGEEATVRVEVKSSHLRPTRRRNLKILECEVFDETGSARAVWYNQAYLAEQLNPGTGLLLRGKLEGGKGGLAFTVRSHEMTPSSSAGEADGVHTLGLVPIYPATEGLTSRKLRQMIWQTRRWAANLDDPLPSHLLAGERLPSRRDAVSAAHFPGTREEAAVALRRLAFEELLIQQLAVAKRKRRRLEGASATKLGKRGSLAERWLASLPFELTSDQRRAVEELDGGLDSGRPMQKLLMGEVGSGKTVVALYAMLRAVESGGQAALMAPTETLAEQHFRTVDELTGGLERVGLLTGSTPAARRRRLLDGLADGGVGLLVGTHALIEQEVRFNDLRVAVVDEQHRFGVGQRTALDEKGRDGSFPHVLHMSATPIPRTLALTAYGDLESITLRQLPKGRKPVKTWQVPERKRAEAYEFIRERIRGGGQCYVVCPLVEESQLLQAKAATKECERLSRGELRDFRVEVLHGQMSTKKKQSAMAAFVDGEIDVLVATSVIEVGIDIPNATVMVIEEAERYGLSQMHQLRGRIGRGGQESFCLLFAEPHSEQARRRMDALVSTDDGFELAEVDLALRGEGEILGTRQSGVPSLRVARLPRDQKLLEVARKHANEMLDDDPELDLPQHFRLRELVQRELDSSEAEALAA